MALLDQLFGNQPQGDGGMVQNILQQRFQPTPQDASQAMYQTAYGATPVSPYAVQQQRMQIPMAVAGQLSNMDLQGQQAQAAQLQNQMLQYKMPYIQQQMQDLYGNGQPTPIGMMPLLQAGNAPAPNQQNGNFPPFGPSSSQNTSMDNDIRIRKAKLAYAMGDKENGDLYSKEYFGDPTVLGAQEGAKTKASEISKQQVEDTTQARGTQDVIGLYDKLNNEAKQAPSGVIENLWANTTNAAGKPNAAAIAKGSYDADLNNLYLAMIRSLKGTGRVMQSELDEMKNAQPKSTDSMEVKQAKAQTHMQYYTNRMTELGYDPSTGKPMGNNQIAPHNLQNVQPGLTPPSQPSKSSAQTNQVHWNDLQ